MGRKSAFAAAAGAGILAVAGVIGGNKLYRRVVVPKARPENESDFSEQVTKGRLFVRNHPGHQDVYLEAIDLLKLHGIYIESDAPGAGEKYAILVHGYNDHAESMGIFAEEYLKRGFHVLLPDLRGYGKSEGNYVGFGYDDRLDILEWIYWILRRDKGARIILHGCSMGAATVLMTAGEHLPEAVKAVVADSSYSTVKDEFAHVIASSGDSPLPFALTYALLRLETRIRAGYDMNDCSPLRAVGRASVPILFLHGEADRLIPVDMATTLYMQAKTPKYMETFAGADHIRCVVTDPERYYGAVDGLLEEVSLL